MIKCSQESDTPVLTTLSWLVKPLYDAGGNNDKGDEDSY